jgi:cell division protein FtsQ
MNPLSQAGDALARAGRRLRHRHPVRPRRWLTRGLIALVVTSAFALTGWFALNSSLFALHYVTVEGTSRLTPTQVLNAARLQQGTSLARVDPGAVARRVEQLSPVAAVHVRRHWPHGLVIDVVERRPVGVVRNGGRAELLDASGVAFASVATAPAGLVIVRVAAPVPGAGEPVARAAMRVFADVPAGVRSRVTKVIARSVDAVSLRLSDGRTVVWGSASNGGTKAAVLRTLMHRSARVYDVSTPSVAVTRG